MGIAPMLISFELGLSMIVGYFVARFFAGPKPNTQGRVPSLVIPFRTRKVHLHHWLLFAPVLGVLLVSHVFLFTPHVFYGFLGGVVAQGVLYYDDWASIVKKDNA